VVLTIQPLPRAFEFNRRTLKEIQDKGWLAGLERLEMLTAEDAEMIGALYEQGVLLSDLLARKLAHPHPKAQNDSLKNYLFWRFRLSGELGSGSWAARRMLLVHARP
jgi:hypothetical protein